MTTKLTTFSLLSVCLVVIVLLSVRAIRQQHTVEAGLPPSSYVTESEVQLLMVEGSDLVAVKGTGSMQPYIPSGEGIVAYAEVTSTPFEQLKAGDLVIYTGSRTGVIHQLIERNGESWIAGGLHNSAYDRTRVTPENYRGKVVHTFLLK